MHRTVRWSVYQEATGISLLYRSLLHVSFHISASLLAHLQRKRCITQWGDPCIERPLKLVTIIGLFNTSLFAHLRLFWHVYLCAPWLDTCLKIPVYLVRSLLTYLRLFYRPLFKYLRLFLAEVPECAMRWYVYEEFNDIGLYYRSLSTHLRLFYTSLFTYLRLFLQMYLSAPCVDTCTKKLMAYVSIVGLFSNIYVSFIGLFSHIHISFCRSTWVRQALIHVQRI